MQDNDDWRGANNITKQADGGVDTLAWNLDLLTKYRKLDYFLRSGAGTKVVNNAGVELTWDDTERDWKVAGGAP